MPTYSDAEMRAIMGRALQIDSGRSDRFTPEQLRTITAELGISTQALEVAMYEADSKGGVMNTQSRAATTQRRFGRTVTFAVIFLLVMAAGLVLSRRTAPNPPIDRVAQPARATPTPVPVEPVSRSPGPVPKKTTTKKTLAPPQL